MCFCLAWRHFNQNSRFLPPLGRWIWVLHAVMQQLWIDTKQTPPSQPNSTLIITTQAEVNLKRNPKENLKQPNLNRKTILKTHAQTNRTETRSTDAELLAPRCCEHFADKGFKAKVFYSKYHTNWMQIASLGSKTLQTLYKYEISTANKAQRFKAKTLSIPCNLHV